MTKLMDTIRYSSDFKDSRIMLYYEKNSFKELFVPYRASFDSISHCLDRLHLLLKMKQAEFLIKNLKRLQKHINVH